VRGVVILASAALAAAVVVAAPAPAMATARRPATITIDGVLPRPARLVVLRLDGSIITAHWHRNAFRFVVAASRVVDATLQLIGTNGRYFGPVVLSSTPGRAFESLSGRADVHLGRLRFLYGYAVAQHRLSASVFDAHRRAFATRSGAPIGAGKLGLVAVPHPRSLLDARTGGFGSGSSPGADRDGDGIPNVFDVDPAGHGLLAASDPSVTASGGLFSTLYLSMAQTLNLDAGTSVNTAAIDALISGQSFALNFYVDPRSAGVTDATGAHIECAATLVYCAPGTGTALIAGGNNAPPGSAGQTWVSYDPDHSGFPNLFGLPSLGPGAGPWAMAILPSVGTAQLQAGDVYTLVFDTPAGPVTQPLMLPPYFVTTPALASYTSMGATSAVTYPVDPAAAGTSPANPIPLGVDGRLSVSFWRPQRLAIPGAESGSYIDMGHLHYGIVLTAASAPATREIPCAGSYTNISPTLTDTATPSDFARQLFPLLDAAADGPPDATSRLAFTLDVRACLASAGEAASGTWTASLSATTDSRPGGVDRGAQSFYVSLP
jgi:hypothetical protein